jgi:hypothetical protein
VFSGLISGEKPTAELRVRRSRYCSDSVVSKRRKVTFLSKRHARVRRSIQAVNGEKQANTLEHFGARLHRNLLSPDEYCPHGLPGLLKACGSRREIRQICSDCGAPLSRHWPGAESSAVFPQPFIDGRSG